MQVSKMFLALLLPSSLYLSSCAKLIPYDVYFKGNWHLLGQTSFLGNGTPSPFLGFVLDKSENTVYSNVVVTAPCSRGNAAIGYTSLVSETSQAAADGTFVLTNSAEPIDSIQYTITGKLPAPGASTWQGTYTIVNSPSSTCVFNFSGSFTATAYPTLNGTYAGTIDGSGLGSGISITLKVSQDEQTLEQSMNGAVTYIPLSGTITVTGSSCFTSGTIVNGQVSQIDADTFMMWASMNDGSTMEIHGWVSDQTEATLTPVDVVIKNGACANAFGSGTLNR